MNKVGIIGNSIDDFADKVVLEKNVEKTIDTLLYQYGKDLVFNISANTGVSFFIADSCIKNSIKYNIFLPFQLENFKDIWFNSQFELLSNHIYNSNSIFMSSFKVKKEAFLNTNKSLIDDSQFIIFFPSAKKQGLTYESMKYSLSVNKLSLNGMDDLKLITRKDIEVRSELHI